jgi:regulator of cell morphogenesis and NO signaling
VEDDLFVPAVQRLERQVAEQGDAALTETGDSDAAEPQESLSDREKEIVRCIVCGLTNKETAAQLYISINTVLTHRKNITRKLNIHSISGLTIYAIVNKLVKLDEVKLA